MSRIAALCALAAALAWSALPALAAGRSFKDVTSAVIRPSDRPAGFSDPHELFVTKFTRVMSVQFLVESTRKKATAKCVAPATIAGDGWTDGVLQAFDASLPRTYLKVCAYRFAGASGAADAYTRLSASVRTRLASHKARPLTSAVIGDESATALTSSTTSQDIKVFTYQVIYRQANLVIAYDFAGPALFSGAQFLHMVLATNRRLR